MNESIKLILSLSLSGSILAAVIFALKPLIKHRLAKSIQYYIWLIVLLRLILPFSFEGSIMNNVFNGEQATVDTVSPGIVMPMGSTDRTADSSSILPNVQKKAANGAYNGDTDHSRYLRDLFSQYAYYLWVLGVIITHAANSAGYMRFAKYLKSANKPAADHENLLLAALVKGRRVRLVRNHLISTPLLIGIFRPCIIISDVDFDEKQLKNILLHEISHLRHFDIGIKWLTMVAASIHWFNPLMHFIKNEINHACELACDEAVIKDFDSLEKQAYGDTLISAAAELKYPPGVLQATMCEEKNSLKERLTAIMKHSKKSGYMMVFSVILLGAVAFGAVYLGAVVGTGRDNPPDSYISEEGFIVRVGSLTYNLSEIIKYKTPYLGDNSKVSAIVGQLPEPDRYYRQRYISMITDGTNKLNVFYEAKREASNDNEWPVENMRRNALVLFCMIDNLKEVTFAFRASQSDGKLDVSKYDTEFNFSRAAIQEQFGDISVMGSDLEKLKAVLMEENINSD